MTPHVFDTRLRNAADKRNYSVPLAQAPRGLGVLFLAHGARV